MLREFIPAFQKYKRLDPLGKRMLDLGNDIQLILKISDPSFTKHVVEKFKSEIAAFHLKTDGIHLIPTDASKTIVHEIPKDLKTMREIDDWFINERPIIPSNSLGVIAARDDVVALSLAHTVADGKYLIGIVHHIFDPIKKLSSPFPITEKEAFEKEFAAYRRPINVFHSDEMTCFPAMQEKTKVEIPYITMTDMKQFMCYDQKTKKCKQFSEALWTAFTLSIGEKFNALDKFGLTIAADVRPFLSKEMKKKIDLTFCNMYSIMDLNVKGDWKFQTLGEFYGMLRKDLKERIARSEYLDYMKLYYDPPNSHPPTGLIPFSSHMGPIHIKEPISDIFITNVAYFGMFNNLLQMMSYSVIDEDRDRNDLVTFMRFGPNGVNFKEVDVINKSWLHVLKNFTPDMQMSNVLSEVKKFQQSYEHTYVL